MSDIDQIKLHIDIVEYISRRMTLKKAGRNYKGLCPFHNEKTPSFMVSPDRQSWHCFGCGKGGSVFDFAMEYDHLDFREALEELADQAGVKLTRSLSTSPQDTIKETLKEIHVLAAEYYQYLLTSHSVGQNAREYLKQRGVTEKIIKTFGLGYSANTWEGVIKFLKKKGYEDEVLELSGLIIPSKKGGYDRFRGRIMFPLRDHRGQTIAFAGRLLDPEIKEAKYINSPETPLYIKGNTVFGLDITKKSIQKEDAVIIMEGEFDVLSSYQAGVSNVVAIKGTALTEMQVHLLKRFAKTFIFSLDSDMAGDAAARRGIDIAQKQNIKLYVARLPQGKDPDDVARTQPHELKQAMKDALSLYDYYVQSIQAKYDVTSAYGKKGFTDELLPLLATIENQVLQAHYLKIVADTIHISENTIVSELNKVRRQIEKKQGSSEEPAVSVETEYTQDLLLLALFLQGDRTQCLPWGLDITHIQTPGIRAVFETILVHVTSNPGLDTASLLAGVPSEYTSIVDQALLWDLQEVLKDEKTFLHMWKQTQKEISKRYIKEQIKKLRMVASDDDSAQKDLLDLTKQLRLLEK
jgi:DNA primase